MVEKTPEIIYVNGQVKECCNNCDALVWVEETPEWYCEWWGDSIDDIVNVTCFDFIRRDDENYE